MRPITVDKFSTEQRPAQPAAGYIGGKRLLAKTITQRIEAIPHDLYAEPFVGMGGIFLRRAVPARCEVINDASGDVANLFRILQRHFPQFMDTMKFQVASRREFERLKACDPSSLTDLERAARFLYLQRLAFGGKVNGRNFGVDTHSPSGFNILKLASLLETIHERLAGVTIENLDWHQFLVRYDRAGALFYLDPPYFGCENDYGPGLFDRDCFARMAEALAGLKGRFILSLNDRPEVRKLFSRFKIEPVALKYTIGGGKKARDAAELLITSGIGA